MIYLPYAIELANQRTHELERRAREIDQIALAALAGRVAPFADPQHPGRPKGPSRARRLVVRSFRAFSDASHAVSEAACTAATRIEGTAR